MELLLLGMLPCVIFSDLLDEQTHWRAIARRHCNGILAPSRHLRVCTPLTQTLSYQPVRLALERAMKASPTLLYIEFYHTTVKAR